MSTKPNLHDAEARLCAVENSSSSFTGYMYDAEGRRIAKGSLGSLACPSSSGFSTLSNQYLLGPGGEQVTELTGNSTIAWYHSNVFAGGKLLATYNSPSGTAELHFHLTDWLGSRRVQTNALGEVEGYYTSLPFGDDLTPNGSDATEHHFTGKERDAESGNDYFGARYFGSSMGRFMSPDSLNTLDLSHPQKLNRYTYANNNPLTNVDVDGNCTAPAVSGGQVGICVESYIRTRFLPGATGKLALGDNRGPNPHGGSFRTQTLLSVDPSTHAVSILTHTPGSSCAIEGCYLGVNHSTLSKTSHDDKGNTYFTLTVYGENGYEANGKTGAPGGWIEMQFSFTVNSKGEVTVSDPETNGYPSVSIYSYDSDGDATDIWQQTESGNIHDLWGPRKHAKSAGQSAIDEDAARQCAGGNPAACNH